MLRALTGHQTEVIQTSLMLKIYVAFQMFMFYKITF